MPKDACIMTHALWWWVATNVRRYRSCWDRISPCL